MVNMSKCILKCFEKAKLQSVYALSDIVIYCTHTRHWAKFILQIYEGQFVQNFFP